MAEPRPARRYPRAVGRLLRAARLAFPVLDGARRRSTGRRPRPRPRPWPTDRPRRTTPRRRQSGSGPSSGRRADVSDSVSGPPRRRRPPAPPFDRRVRDPLDVHRVPPFDVREVVPRLRVPRDRVRDRGHVATVARGSDPSCSRTREATPSRTTDRALDGHWPHHIDFVPLIGVIASHAPACPRRGSTSRSARSCRARSSPASSEVRPGCRTATIRGRSCPPRPPGTSSRRSRRDGAALGNATETDSRRTCGARFFAPASTSVKQTQNQAHHEIRGSLMAFLSCCPPNSEATYFRRTIFFVSAENSFAVS